LIEIILLKVKIADFRIGRLKANVVAQAAIYLSYYFNKRLSNHFFSLAAIRLFI